MYIGLMAVPIDDSLSYGPCQDRLPSLSPWDFGPGHLSNDCISASSNIRFDVRRVELLDVGYEWTRTACVANLPAVDLDHRDLGRESSTAESLDSSATLPRGQQGGSPRRHHTPR